MRSLEGYRQKNSSYGTNLNSFKSQKVNGLTSNDLPRHPTQYQTQRKRISRKSKSNTSEINTEGINNANITEETQNEERLVTGQVVGNSEDTQKVLNRILALSLTYRKARVTALVVRAIKNIVLKKNIKGPLSLSCRRLKND